MEKDKVPQDEGITGGITREVQYAVDKDGNYVKALSKGWEPKNIVNQIAWEQIEEQMEEARQKIIDGKASPILYFMEKHQMIVPILADYVGLAKWKVKRHLKPRNFNKLSDEQLGKYAEIFEISIDELKNYKG